MVKMKLPNAVGVTSPNEKSLLLDLNESFLAGRLLPQAHRLY